MSKLMIAMIAGTFAATAAAETEVLEVRTIADHGTPAMHAAEAQKHTVASTAAKRLLPDAGTVRDATEFADHGTPVIHAADARRNLDATRGTAKPLPTNKSGQDAVKEAVKGATK